LHTGDTSAIQGDAAMTSGEAAVRGFADAISNGNVEAAIAVADPEIEFLSVLAVGGRPYVGHGGIRQYFADVSSAWSRWTVEVHRVAPSADGRVAIAMTMHVVGKESGAGFAVSTGHVWTTRNGKLLRNQPYRDADEALRTIGEQP
jgi:ketosteroid isomerase-like protein